MSKNVEINDVLSPLCVRGSASTISQFAGQDSYVRTERRTGRSGKNFLVIDQQIPYRQPKNISIAIKKHSVPC